MPTSMSCCRMAPQASCQRHWPAFLRAAGLGRLAFLRTHPTPWERAQTLNDTSRFFRPGYWEALGTGIVVGLAAPGLLQLVLFLQVTFNGLGIAQPGWLTAELGGVLMFVPLVAGIVGARIWRATTAALLREETLPGAIRTGCCLCSGLLLGAFASVQNMLHFQASAFGNLAELVERFASLFQALFLSSFPWNLLFLLAVCGFFAYITILASAWFAAATSRRASGGLTIAGLAVACLLAIPVLSGISAAGNTTWAIAQLPGQSAAAFSQL